MRPYIHIFALAMMATALTACESLQSRQDVTVTQGPVNVVQPVEITDAELQRTYSQALLNSGDSSVQIFSIDAHPMAAPAQVVVQQPVTHAPYLPQGRGQQFGGNSHVTVFSLDDQNPSYNLGGVSPATPHGRGGIPPMIDHLTPMPGTGGTIGARAGMSAYQDGVARVYFSHGGKNVNSEGKDVTAQIGQQCRSGGCGVVKVEGHASTRAVAKDEVQRRIINLKISMDRAMNVMRQLVRDGVPAGSIQVTAHGDRVPPIVVPGGDAEAAARRVEILTGSH